MMKYIKDFLPYMLLHVEYRGYIINPVCGLGKPSLVKESILSDLRGNELGELPIKEVLSVYNLLFYISEHSQVYLEDLYRCGELSDYHPGLNRLRGMNDAVDSLGSIVSALPIKDFPTNRCTTFKRQPVDPYWVRDIELDLPKLINIINYARDWTNNPLEEELRAQL